jgi:hypothetical protein
MFDCFSQGFESICVKPQTLTCRGPIETSICENVRRSNGIPLSQLDHGADKSIFLQAGISQSVTRLQQRNNLIPSCSR